MKAFYHKAKGALALTLAMTMFCPQVFAADALSAEAQGVKAAPVVELTEEEIAAMQLPQLTYDEALAKAKKNSTELKDFDELADMLREERRDQIDSIGSLEKPKYEYQHWVDFGEWAKQAATFATLMEQQSTGLQREMQMLIIEMSVKSSFVDILSQQDSLELAKKSAEMQDTLYKQAQLKHRLGMISTYGAGGLDEKRIAAEQAKNNVALAEHSLTQTYTNFNRLLGEPEDKRYELVYDVTYEPYEMSQTMSQYINDKLSNDDLTIKLLELSVEGAKFSNNYLPIDVPAGVTDPYDAEDRNEYSWDSAKRNLKKAKQEKETLIQNAYLSIKQLETMRDSAESDLKKAETQLKVAEVNYKAGNVTKLVVEQAEMGLISAQNALKTNAYNHDMLIYTFENPSLLSSSTK